MPSLCAMSLLLAPSARRRSTSISRGVSETDGGFRGSSFGSQELNVELSMKTADAAVDSNSAADPARLQVPTTSKRSDSEIAAARPARTMGDSPITNTRILSSDPFNAAASRFQSLIMRCRHPVRGFRLPRHASLRPFRFRPFADRDTEICALAAAKNNDRQFPGDGASQSSLEIVRIGDGLAADFNDDVAKENSSFFSRTARLDTQDHD